MRLAGMQKLTLLDYPGKTAATVFTPGCNFRCPFCHNADLVAGDPGAWPSVPEAEVFALLEKRHGLLDGVCITGGEPLLQPDIAEFCCRIKAAGFAVKLDTNGSLPQRLQPLLEQGLVDYVAMDVKNAPGEYARTIGLPSFDYAPIRQSMRLIRESGIACEFRTTVVRELHSEESLLACATQLEPQDSWFLQSFVDRPGVLAGEGTMHAWDPAALQSLLPQLQAIIPHTHLRGIE